MGEAVTTGEYDDEALGCGASRSSGRGPFVLEGLFALPRPIQVPGDHRDIEILAESGHHADAARAIEPLRFGSLLDRNRAALARAVCLMNAGQPQLAAEVLASERRTMASAWYLACALVRLDRLQDAADLVLWVGERIPLLGGQRRAAQVLLGVLGRPLPSWLDDRIPEAPRLEPAGRIGPPPYLASFFRPARPAVPLAFGDVAEAIQRGAYAEAAQRLVAHPVADPRVGHQVAVATAECWLLADDPEAAEAWLRHRRSCRGVWALTCALVQQNRLTEALAQLTWLARHASLDDDQRTAAAVLLAHLGMESPPPGLEDLDHHVYHELSRAKEAGYQRFAEETVGRIERQSTAADAELVIHEVVAACANLPEEEALRVLVPAYEAAVRTFFARAQAEHGLRLLLSRPERLGSDPTGYSRALLFATACDRLDDLHRALHRLAERQHDERDRYACWLASAKLSLVEGDALEVIDHAGRAIALPSTEADRKRARRLRRASRWLVPRDPPRISEWRLRRLHHLLPLAVAEKLEDRDSLVIATLALLAGGSAQGRQAVEAANHHFDEAVAIAKDPAGTLAELRRALGRWALHVGIALLDASAPGAHDAVPFTGAAWCLLGPDPAAVVRAVHARALGLACAGIATPDGVAASVDAGMRAMPGVDGAEPSLVQDVLDAWRDCRLVEGEVAGTQPPDLVRLLRPVATPRPFSRGRTQVILGELPCEARRVIDDCLADRFMLLPDAPPFRGRRWFDSDSAQSLYQRGREETDARAAYKAFEEAWMREPNNHVAIHGLILGLARRLSEKSSRNHLLEHLARVFDQMADREVEAALAYTTLADLVDGGREQRSYLARAAAALQRRVRRRPWTRARNAQIAIHLELGNLREAAQAAWEESCTRLAGSEASNRYAALAATLWQRTPDAEHSLHERGHEAELRSRIPRPTNREAVQDAVTTGRLVTLSDLDLDGDALEDLWRACRGDEDELCRFLEKLGSRDVDPRPHYLDFLTRKLVGIDPPAAARIRNCFMRPAAAPTSAPASAGMAWLRLAAAELVAHDPLHEVATPRDQLGPVPVRQFLARLRDASRGDAVAYQTFHSAVDDALAALFELREAVPAREPEQYGGRLAGASEALGTVVRAARRFGTRDLAHVAGMLARYLALGLDSAAADAYLREKEKRLVPSRLGLLLGRWWAGLCEVAAPLEFFHYHQAYHLPDGVRPEDWWRTHRVHGSPVRAAVERLLESLEVHARRLDEIEERYLRSRMRRDLGTVGFGLREEFAACCAVLRSAVAPGAPAVEVRAIEPALERLGTALRRIDVARLVDLDGVFYDNRVATGQYLLPRATELLHHWRRNAAGGHCLQVILEVRDDAGQDVLCMMCLDEGARPAPESTPLRGLARFADLVDALGGQFHLWMARPGERSGCRREHPDRLTCAAGEYAARIDEQLRKLVTSRWHTQRSTVEPWLGVLDRAIHSKGSATLAFAILPQLCP